MLGRLRPAENLTSWYLLVRASMAPSALQNRCTAAPARGSHFQTVPGGPLSCSAALAISRDDRAGSRAPSLCLSCHTITREVSTHAQVISPALRHFTQ